MKHDDDTICSSAKQIAWVNIVEGMRNRLEQFVGKKRMSVESFEGLISLASDLVQLEVFVNSFDETCTARKAKLERKLVP